MREIIAACLADGERVTVHWWFDRRETEWRVKAPEPLPPPARIYLVEAEARDGATCHYLEPRRLLLLPLARARALHADAVAVDRDTYGLRDALERALRRPERFGVDAYGPLDDVPRARGMTAEEKLASIPRCAGVEAPADYYVPPRACRPDNDNDGSWERDHAALLEQVGMHVDEAGRYHATPPEPGLEHWLEQLRHLEHGPTYVNGVPVRRLPCVPARYEVATYELTAEIGMGGGGRIRRTFVMSLWEAARHVQTGRCPHYKYSEASDRWTETA